MIALSCILGLVTIGVPFFCSFLGVTGNALLPYAVVGYCVFVVYISIVTWKVLKSEFPVYEKE